MSWDTDRLTPEELALYELMSDESEDALCAGWIIDNEFYLWWEITESGRELRGRKLAIKTLADMWDRWILRDDDGPRGVGLAEWREIYARAPDAKRQAYWPRSSQG